MRDEASAEAQRRFREEVLPRVEGGESRLIAALLVSRHRGAVAAQFGGQLLRVLEASHPSVAPVNAQLRVEVGGLADAYDQRVAKAEVNVGGRAMTLARARALLSSESADVRREAFEQYYGWFKDQRDELGGLLQLGGQRGRRARAHSRDGARLHGLGEPVDRCCGAPLVHG
jgi:hypothetical protein